VGAGERHLRVLDVVDGVAAGVGEPPVQRLLVGRRDRLADVLDGGVGGRAAAGPHRADLAVGGPVEREHVAAEPRRRRLDDVERGGGRDRRVEGVAAVRHDGGACLRGEGLARRDDAALAVHRRPSGVESVQVRFHTPPCGRRGKGGRPAANRSSDDCPAGIRPDAVRSAGRGLVERCRPFALPPSIRS
jgi:hypothetical protein